MEKIDEILNSIKIDSSKIQRIKYHYDEEIAKNVFIEISNKMFDELIMNDSKKEVWNNVLKYAHGFEPLNTSKGLYIFGSTGSMKTSVFDILNLYFQIDNMIYLQNRKYHLIKFFKVSSKKIIQDFIKNENYEQYISIKNLLIDDLGAENQKVNNYGTITNVIEEIIEERYSRNIGFTHFTSNYSIEKINEIYGSRVYSRINHMCNILEMKSNDVRLFL